MGGNIFPIPWDTINNFAYRHGIISSYEFDSFLMYIRAIDNEYIEIRRKERDSQKNLNKHSKKRSK